MKLILLILGSLLVLATTGQDVKKKTVEAGEVAVEYTKEQKDAFVRDMEENIDSVKKEIKDLKTKAGKETDEKVKRLEAYQAQLEKDLAKLKKSTGSAWQEVRKGTVSAWEELRKAVSNAKKELTE